jgi:hypothetical protein
MFLARWRKKEGRKPGHHPVHRPVVERLEDRFLLSIFPATAANSRVVAPTHVLMFQAHQQHLRIQVVDVDGQSGVNRKSTATERQEIDAQTVRGRSGVSNVKTRVEETLYQRPSSTDKPGTVVAFDRDDQSAVGADRDHSHLRLPAITPQPDHGSKADPAAERTKAASKLLPKSHKAAPHPLPRKRDTTTDGQIGAKHKSPEEPLAPGEKILDGPEPALPVARQTNPRVSFGSGKHQPPAAHIPARPEAARAGQDDAQKTHRTRLTAEKRRTSRSPTSLMAVSRVAAATSTVATS